MHVVCKKMGEIKAWKVEMVCVECVKGMRWMCKWNAWDLEMANLGCVNGMKPIY